ncbi:MAG: hypothetical protein K1060chlam1_00587 [Candidatus Anoxychlamydiales bacterium]|nr:hypothetical protein [Candidatus Anoxychlamydiales bacterium]
MNNKNIILVIFASITLLSCTAKHQESEISCIQIVDRNGLTETISSEENLKKYEQTNFDKTQPYQKVLRIYNKDAQNNSLSILTTYHENGQIWKYLDIKNARAFGKYKEYHSNGKLKIDANVISGAPDFNNQESWLFDRDSYVYNEKGDLISKFYYEKGSLQKDTIYYYSNGQIKKIIPYIDDEVTGEIIQYTKSGEILSKTTYKNGIKHGSNIGFFSKENIAFIEDYENNLLITGQYFKKSRVKTSLIKNGDGQKAIYKNQQITKLIEYKNGKPEGRVQIFSLEGNLQNEYFQKDDIKEGIETEYYKKNEIPKSHKKNEKIPKLEITWSSGNIHGTVKTWYKNLKLESQKEYVHNKKNGPHFVWYENGSVMFIEEYENDTLTKGSYYQINQKDPISTIINGNGIATLFDKEGRYIKKIMYTQGKPIQ